ncbi:MAG: hypothetical protein EOP07_04445 [Proteobacteria bacterium]|nr:MAG: hypothetical protein EOP07_04445 [Pseudomonadota bacterium]
MTMRWTIKSVATLAAILLPAFLLANCTMKGTGSQRAKILTTSGSSDAAPADEGTVDEGTGEEACLKLAAKRAKNMKLLEDGEEVEPETTEETAACPTEEDTTTEEEVPAE